MLIAQISDLHVRADGTLLYGLIDPLAALDACVAHLRALSPCPDVVLATGDLADTGRSEDYAALRRAFDQLAMPVYAIPGNHDDRENLRAAFADLGYLPADGTFLHYTIEDFALRLIGLDTVIAGETSGRMCEERMAWLDARLSERPERPTLIFMHHPPFATGIAAMDTPPFEGGTELERVIRRHPQVRHIVCGHIHRPIHVGWAGTVVAVAPSTIFQLNLELSGARVACVPEPPACALYLWRDSRGPVAHLSLIGDFGRPRPA